MFLYPHYYTPTPEAQAAAHELMAYVRSYMDSHPDSELHTRGKMFGILLTEPSTHNSSPIAHNSSPITLNPNPSTLNHEPLTLNHKPLTVLWAFSGVLDGSYHHDGFVEPIFEIHPSDIVGANREDSQLKQRWLFSQYRLLNAHGETRTILDLWSDSPDSYDYNRYSANSPSDNQHPTESPLALSEALWGKGLGERGPLPPSGTGECCAPKLLQAAYRLGLKPVAMAEFWMGASPKDEIRIEGQFYPACIAKCRPVLRYMLQGIEVAENPLITQGRLLAKQTKVLYEDETLLVASKPSGLLTVPGKDEQYSLQQHLGYKAAHRLDMDTSGIVILAKTNQAYTELQRQFASHEIDKVYRARITPSCSCALSAGEGLIDLPLLANPLDRPRQIVNWQHGKRAVTRWKILSGNESTHTNTTQGILIELYPETGRTHQLRVHCAHPDGLDAPILGDRLYGYGPSSYSSTSLSQSPSRLMLHAYKITFAHPVTGERMTIIDTDDDFV